MTVRLSVLPSIRYQASQIKAESEGPSMVSTFKKSGSDFEFSYELTFKIPTPSDKLARSFSNEGKNFRKFKRNSQIRSLGLEKGTLNKYHARRSTRLTQLVAANHGSV